MAKEKTVVTTLYINNNDADTTVFH